MPRGSSHSDKHYVAPISINHFSGPSKVIDILISLLYVSPSCTSKTRALLSSEQITINPWRVSKVSTGFYWEITAMNRVTVHMFFLKSLQCLEYFEVNKGMMFSLEICAKSADVLRKLQLWCRTFYHVPQVRSHIKKISATNGNLQGFLRCKKVQDYKQHLYKRMTKGRPKPGTANATTAVHPPLKQPLPRPHRASFVCCHSANGCVIHFGREE